MFNEKITFRFSERSSSSSSIQDTSGKILTSLDSKRNEMSVGYYDRSQLNSIKRKEMGDKGTNESKCCESVQRVV